MIGILRHVAASLRPLIIGLPIAAGLMAFGAQPAHAQTEGPEYYATDALGSIRVVFDGAGQVIARSDYLPFGEAWAPSGNLPTQRFTGQQRDGDEGLDYFGARSYQTRTSRLNAVDPVFAGLFEPQRWNRYAYALNSSLGYTDPDGRCAVAAATDRSAGVCADMKPVATVPVPATLNEQVPWWGTGGNYTEFGGGQLTTWQVAQDLFVHGVDPSAILTSENVHTALDVAGLVPRRR